MIKHGFQEKPDARVLFIAGFHVTPSFCKPKNTNYPSTKNCSDLNLNDFAYKSIIYHDPDSWFNRPLTTY